MAGCTLGADGSWNLEWMMNSGMDGIVDYRLLYCGVMVGDRVRVGTLEGTDLTEGKLSSLPKTEQEMMAALDRSGWAVVDNPNPADRLHLRASPQKSAASLGKFYNGTPVQVLENLGEWCHVRIGLDGNLEGYMMTRYLAFGVQMDEVGTAFPEMVFLEEQVRRVLYADMRLTQEAGTVDTGYYWIVGVVDNSLYIVLTENGMIGYAPQDWFWAGNG